MSKWIVVTGTRADFYKLTPVIDSLIAEKQDILIFCTGMHLLQEYGFTAEEVLTRYRENTYVYSNSFFDDHAGLSFSNACSKLDHILRVTEPDFIVVHGDRPEALAAACTSVLHRIRVIHIEGGEVSGTIDDSMRHAISKLSHVHIVSSNRAARYLREMGEDSDRIQILGSPEQDFLRGDLPDFEKVREYYELPSGRFGAVLFHPVVDDENFARNAEELFKALAAIDFPLVVIKWNNDEGHRAIETLFDRYLAGKPEVRLIPSMRFPYYLSMISNASFAVGNSSSIVREIPVLGVPCINVGDRQVGRSQNSSIQNVDYDSAGISELLTKFSHDFVRFESSSEFGEQGFADKFSELLRTGYFETVSRKKRSHDAG